MQVKESVLLSSDIVKVNRKGKHQVRSLVVTSLALYNFPRGKFKAFKRRLALHDLVRAMHRTPSPVNAVALPAVWRRRTK